ncbi:MAG: type III polyketide synthase [Planctomycetia bacterium]|jgi:predicted naringenin-chalcone synthase
MSLTILGIGTAAPERTITQADAAVLAAGFANAEPGRERTLAAIYRQTRIRTRGSVLLEEPTDKPFAQSFYPPAADTDDSGPTTAARMARYQERAGGLATTAARLALESGRVAASDITHLVTCSCTGFANPGVDLEVMHALGLGDAVARTHVGFMGCHGAFNALRVADAFATADPAATVLVVCVELCSLHFQYGSRSDHVVANSIFADGAGAVVGVGASHRRGRETGLWRLAAQSSRVLPASGDQMGWVIGDNGFEMSLSAQVPGTIARDIGGLVGESLAAHGLAAGDVRSWAVHPGGPRVLAGVQEALALPPGALDVSHAVLAEHGNMSSATILFILERVFRHGAGPCVAMAFGPGLTAELALLDRGVETA